MIDLRPVAYVIGLLLACFGVAMLVPMAVDLWVGNANWIAFAEAAAITFLAGTTLTLACANADRSRLSLQQTFLLTTGVWVALPVFAALPFALGEVDASYTDAFFEAMSGLTTTGSTVLSGLEDTAEGTLLWRGLLQWFGGIGIIVVAMVFLPELRIGGMQIFRSEGFDTAGKILPRAREIATSIAGVYLLITLTCGVCYLLAGKGGFDAVVHAMTTVATGGFANSDASFGDFGAGVQYVAIAFMILAALPFVRFVQMISGTARPLVQDRQVHAFLLIALALVLLIAGLRWLAEGRLDEASLRAALFNAVSLLTGTGYASADYMAWGAGAVMVLFFAGLIGGCAGSTACSVKVFRYQILFAAIMSAVRRIHSPHGIFPIRFEGRRVPRDVLSSVMAFFVLFVVSIGVVSVALAFAGLDFITAVSGAATALANVGPGLGPEIGPAGNFGGLNDLAKWILAGAMLIGRLELMVVYALFTVRFWRS